MSAATRLREAREAAGLSARGLCIRAGVALGLAALIESGAKGMGHKSAHAFAEVLGVSSGWLLFGEGVKRPRKRAA